MMTGLKDINWVERRLFYGNGVPEGHIGPPERYWPEGFSAVLKPFYCIHHFVNYMTKQHCIYLKNICLKILKIDSTNKLTTL